MSLINDIVEKWADRLENRAPNPNNPNHINELSIILTEMGMYEIKDELIGNLTEADKQFSNPLLNKIITYQNEKGEQKKAPIGNLLRLAADHPGRKAAEAMLPKDGTPERKELNKSLGSEKDGRSVPTANNTKKVGDTKPQAKDDKEDPTETPQTNPMFTKDADPAMAARMDTEKQTLDKLAKADKPEQSTELEPVSSDPNSKAKQFKGETSGKDIQTIPMEGGGQVYGTVHRNRKMVDDIINHIKATIPEEKWKDIVFVGEGGSTNDSGELVFHDEMKYAAPKFKQLGAGIDTWDGDELDVHDDQSKLYKRQMEKTGFNQSQVNAGNWASMIGQGEGTDTMSPNDYLDDEGKKFLQDEAVNAGFPPIENWDEPTDRDIDTLYRLSFPEDYGDKETKINDIQIAFNEIRDENLIEKTKQLQSQGKIPITIAGESHIELVDKMMQKSEKPNSDFKPVEPSDVTKEMPKADSAAFSGQSDIDKLTKQERKEISMKIDELNKLTQDAIEKGDKAPNYNLCQVTVPGTNLYCDNNLGIPREDMPQFKGKPQPGTPAADMPVDKNGEVDTEPLFKKMLADKGIKVLDTEIPSDSLKATQSELVGSKVAGMTKALEKDPNHPAITAPIYVSRDGYVVDGHHRWAAVTSAAIKAGKPTDMKVRVIDMDAKDIIPMANKFAEEQGVAAKKADANQEGPKSDIANVPKVEDEKGTTAKTPSGKTLYSVGGGYYSDRPNGEPKFIRTETIARKAFLEGDEKSFLLIFEAEFSADVQGGKAGKFKEIKPEDRKDAADDLKDTQTSNGKTKTTPVDKPKKFVPTSEDKDRLKYRKEELAKIIESGLIPTQKKKLTGAGAFDATEPQMKALLDVTKKQIENPEYRLPLPKYNVSEDDINTVIQTMKDLLGKEFSSVYNSIKKAGGVDPQLTTREAGNQRVRDIIKKYLETGGRSAITGEFVPFNQMQLDHHIPYGSATQRVADKKKKGIETTLLEEQDELDSPENWDLMETSLNQLKNALEGNALIEKINKKLSASPDEKEKKELETLLKNVRRRALLTSLVTSFGNDDYSGINEEILDKFNQDEMNVICKAWNWYHPNTKDSEQFREIDPQYDEKLKARGIDTSVRHPLSITRGAAQIGGSRGRGQTKPVGELRKSFLAVVNQAGIKLMSKKDVKKTDLAFTKAVRDVETATKPHLDKIAQLKQKIKQQNTQAKK